MGFLKLIVKQNAGKEYLRNAVNYITENADACCYSGINICPERVYKQMRKVKKYYGKTSGNQLVHFVVCFNNEVVDLATAEKYTRKIAEYYKSRYQILYAIHHELRRLSKNPDSRQRFGVKVLIKEKIRHKFLKRAEKRNKNGDIRPHSISELRTFSSSWQQI